MKPTVVRNDRFNGHAGTSVTGSLANVAPVAQYRRIQQRAWALNVCFTNGKSLGLMVLEDAAEDDTWIQMLLTVPGSCTAWAGSENEK